MVAAQPRNTENGYTAVVSPAYLITHNIVTKGAYTLLTALKNTSDE